MRNFVLYSVFIGFTTVAYSDPATFILSNKIPGTEKAVDAMVYGPDPGNPFLRKTGNTVTNGFSAGTQVYFGARLLGSNYVAQLFAAAGFDQPEESLIAFARTTTFRGFPQNAGYLALTTVSSTEVPSDYFGATFAVRAWDNSSGLYPTWIEAKSAWEAGLIAAGESALVNLHENTGGIYNTPVPLYGLESFNIYYIPEPACAKLVVLCAVTAAIFWRRRILGWA